MSGLHSSIPELEVIGHAESCRSALHSMTSLAPDMVILHADPRKSGGLELIRHLACRYPRCEVVILCKQADASGIKAFLATCADQTTTGRHAETYINPEDFTQLQASIERAAAEKERAEAESYLVRSDGMTRYLYDYVDYISSEQRGTSYSGVVHGITERRRTQIGRRHAEIERMEVAERIQAFVGQLPGMPYIASLDKPRSTIYVGPKVEQLLGFTAEQWCKDPDLRIRQLDEEDRDRVTRAIENAVLTKGGFSIDYRIHRSDGTVRWLHDEASVVTNSDGEPLFMQGAVIDITERKEAQAELERSHHELQELIAALDSLRVEEQKRLAHEMHDDFGQLLAAMKMDISTLRQHLPESDSKVAQYLGNINDLIDTMVASVRRIIADLPPKILEDVGLFSALEMMVSNFEKRHKIACRLQLSDVEPKLDTRVNTAIYRMVQETLNNVAKHAQATRVDVSVGCSGTSVQLNIADNGCGITGDSSSKPGSFGLIGMRERVMALGGEMKIESAVGKGTEIRITIPLGSREQSSTVRP